MEGKGDFLLFKRKQDGKQTLMEVLLPKKESSSDNSSSAARDDEDGGNGSFFLTKLPLKLVM